MAQIPGLPTVEPVARPMMSPAQAGIPGETIAQLGQETHVLASEQMQIEQHIVAAQRQLEAKQGELALKKYEEQTHEELSKTNTAEGPDTVYENWNKEAMKVLEPYGKDPRVARALDMYRQQLDIEMRHTASVRKTKIISEQSAAATKLKGEELHSEAITAQRSGGDTSVATAKFELILQNDVARGIINQQTADLEMHDFKKNVAAGLVTAAMYSTDPAERQQTIQQLDPSGTGKGKLDLSMIDPTERAVLHDKAQKVDAGLTRQAGAANFNAVYSDMLTEFRRLGIEDDHGAQLQWLKDGEHLPKDPRGNPDWKIGDELRAYVKEAGADHQIALEEQADKFINASSAAASKGHYWQAESIVRQNIDAIQAPKKYKGLAQHLTESIRSAANRDDEAIPHRTNAIAITNWLDRIDAGEDYNDPKVKAELFGDRHLKAESIVSIGRYARAHEDKTISGALSLANERIKKNFPTTQTGMIQAMFSEGFKPKSLQDFSDFEQLEIDAYANARAQLAEWTTQQHQLAAAGKRPSVTLEDILQQGEKISLANQPKMVDKLDAIHRDRKKAVPRAEPTRPANVPKDYVFQEYGPKGRGWYKPTPDETTIIAP